MTSEQHLLRDIESWLSKNEKNCIQIFYDGRDCPVINCNKDVPHNFITCTLPTHSMYHVDFNRYDGYGSRKHLQYDFEKNKLVSIRFVFILIDGGQYQYQVMLGEKIRVVVPYTSIQIKTYEPTSDICILYEHVTNFIKMNNTFNLNKSTINDYFTDMMRLETLIHRLNDYALEDIIIEI